MTKFKIGDKVRVAVSAPGTDGVGDGYVSAEVKKGMVGTVMGVSASGVAWVKFSVPGDSQLAQYIHDDCLKPAEEGGFKVGERVRIIDADEAYCYAYGPTRAPLRTDLEDAEMAALRECGGSGVVVFAETGAYGNVRVDFDCGDMWYVAPECLSLVAPEDVDSASGSGAEERVTSATGGEKGRKDARLSLVPMAALTELAEHYGRGEAKYPTGEDGVPNFRKGYDWSLSFDAAMRHLVAFWKGEDIDPENGSKHVIAAAWHCLTLATYMDEHREYDDRPDVKIEEAK